MKQYIKLSEYAKNRSITYRTAWNHFKDNKIDGAYKDSTGHILVPINSEIDYSICICYSRVSSNKQKDDLKRQQERIEEYATINGYNIYKSYKEVASGMNDNRYYLNKIINDDNWNTLIVENKDRLTRFGFNYLESLFNKLNKKIVVINNIDNDKEDLMGDLISIIYSFSARIYGLRRRRKKDDIINFLDNK